MLAYVAWGQDNVPQIYTIRTDGSRRRQLTTGGGLGPVWSPDGSRLAFWWKDRIGVMNADGTVRGWVATGTNPTWSPDGRRLAYSCQEDAAMCVTDLGTGRETVIVPQTVDWIQVGEKDWSPDGSSIVFTRTSSEGDSYSNFRQLFLVRPDGTDLEAVPNTASTATGPAWSPDGSALLYVERYDGRGGEFSGDVYSVRPDGTARTPVVKHPGTDDNPTWAPNGRSIAFTSAAFLYPRMQGVWTASLEGTGRQLVARGGEDPSWRPGFEASATVPPVATESSRRRLAYVAASELGFDLFVVRPSGNRARRLTDHGRTQNPEWSPDHTQIAYTTSHGGIRVLSVRTGVDRKVARVYGVQGLAWSPSGLRLAWGDFEGLSILDLVSGHRRRITVGGGWSRDPVWSPDGRQLAFSRESSIGQTDIMTMSASGKRLRRVTHLGGMEGQPDWSPDGRSIAFIHEQGPYFARSSDVLAMRPDGRHLRVVAANEGLSFSPSWSSDGRLAWYSDGRRAFGPSPRAGLWIVDSRGRRQLIVANRTIAYLAW